MHQASFPTSPSSSSLTPWLKLKSAVRNARWRPHKKLTSPPFARAKLPYIPPEIWGLIIHHAALAYSDPLYLSPELTFLTSSASSLLTTYPQAMRDKRSFTLVNKQWNAFAIPYLYEFVWIASAAQAKMLAHTLLLQSLSSNENENEEVTDGRYIRRIHISTPILERCAPADLFALLSHSPRLLIFADRFSVQRALYSCAADADPRFSSQAILRLFARNANSDINAGGMKALCWTSYGGECDADLLGAPPPSSSRGRVTWVPMLENLGARLEYLELASCSVSPSPSQPSISTPALTLPNLRTLKLSLPLSATHTFSSLATWHMPRLNSLSILSSDFSYTDTDTGPGWRAFFRSHGAKVRELELGQSLSLLSLGGGGGGGGGDVGGVWVTARPRPVLGFGVGVGEGEEEEEKKGIETWCPNLHTFICSAATAEWCWRSPDWIAPHVLLPSHRSVETIGVRDIEGRLWEDYGVLERAGNGDGEEEEGYWRLYQQLCSLLGPPGVGGPFPNLRCIRDLSRASLAYSHSPGPRKQDGGGRSTSKDGGARDEAVRRFWRRVVRRCAEVGVRVEDCEGRVLVVDVDV